MNKVAMIGNLTKDIEIKMTQGGQAVGKTSIATSERYRDKTTGEQKEISYFHNLVIWGKTAENMAKFFHKGSKVYIEGKVTNRSWDGPDGAKKYITEIVVNSFEFMQANQSQGQPEYQAGYSQPQAPQSAAQPAQPAQPEEEQINIENISW
jgi:single-strand DNA-binding protein